MVCACEAQRELAEALGEDAMVPSRRGSTTATLCDYQYPERLLHPVGAGSVELGPDLHLYDMLKKQLGDAGRSPTSARAPYQTSNGSVVVRKDWKVLLVNIAGLPARFGVPPTAAGDIAVTVADVILGCWAGD